MELYYKFVEMKFIKNLATYVYLDGIRAQRLYDEKKNNFVPYDNFHIQNKI
jgi:hypothetical protein